MDSCGSPLTLKKVGDTQGNGRRQRGGERAGSERRKCRVDTRSVRCVCSVIVTGRGGGGSRREDLTRLPSTVETA